MMIVKTADCDFGSCPQCPEADMPEGDTPWPRLSIPEEDWYYCDEHRTKWLLGFDLFPDAGPDGEPLWIADRLAGATHIAQYRDVSACAFMSPAEMVDAAERVLGLIQ